MASPTSSTSSKNEKHNRLRVGVEKAFSSIGQLYTAALSPIHPEFVISPANDIPPPSGRLVSDLDSINLKDVKTLLESFYAQYKGVENDNSLLLENIVELLAKLPADSKEGKTQTDGFINQLWNGLPHPPASSLGTKYKYRDADGGNNNLWNPEIGRANTPYARSVRPEAIQNIALPDPGDIFDILMARPEGEFEPHPNGISSMLFYQASIIIHDLFRTDHADFNNSKTSSYLDLAPLYGSNEEEQKNMRTFEDGKIKPDCFSEKRLLGFPPGVGVLLIMYGRMHNYIVEQLALINENSRFSKPESGLPQEQWDAAWSKYDNDLFQTGRLINCGLYVNIILKDYVRTILSLNRTQSTWDLDPRSVEAKTLFHTPAAEGVGNQVSAEFNLIYRWHSAVSEKDDKWTQQEYSRLFPGKDPKDVSLEELISGLAGFEKSLDKDPLKRPFANLKRNKHDNTLDDDALVEILTESIEDPAGAFGANRVPQILRSVEILGIMQARSWNLASLNEFRAFFGITKHKTFEDINPDPIVAKNLRSLYDHPDFVELYPGLVAEKAKPAMSPGSGLCANYTTTRVILSDAVSLVRGDRFYTTDYTPKNLTNWGFAEVQYDNTIDQGHVIFKLFYRAFPKHFKANSIYAHYPFVTPSTNADIYKDLDLADKYDWSRPERTPDMVVVNSYASCKAILNDQTNFKVIWGTAIEHLVQHSNETYGKDYCLAGDKVANAESREVILKAFYPVDWKSEVKTFYTDIFDKLMREYSYKIGKANQVDIVRDIAGLANTHFAANVFSLPLKSERDPFGIYNEQELSLVLTILFMSVFYDVDPCKSFQLGQASQTLGKQLGDLCSLRVAAIKAGSVLLGDDLVDYLHDLKVHPVLSGFGTHMVEMLLKSGKSIKEVVWTHLMPTAASMTANQTHLFAQTLDYFMGDGSEHWAELVRIASEPETDETDELLMKYFLEGSRLTTITLLVRKLAPSTSTTTPAHTLPAHAPLDPHPTHLAANATILLNLPKASLDPEAFPDPLKVDLNRPMDSYIHYGLGPHQCAGKEISKLAMVTLFRLVLRLPGLRRAPSGDGGYHAMRANLAKGHGVHKENELTNGTAEAPAPSQPKKPQRGQGELNYVLEQLPGVDGGMKAYLSEDWGSLWAVPRSWKVRWDGDGFAKEY